MWISKKRFETLEKEVAALKKEQPLLRELIKSSTESNEALLRIVKELRADLVEQLKNQTEEVG